MTAESSTELHQPPPRGAGKLSLDGRVAVITGAATGIGRAAAIQFARAGGACVAVVDIADGEPVVEQIAAAGGPIARAYRADVSDAGQVEAQSARSAPTSAVSTSSTRTSALMSGVALSKRPSTRGNACWRST